MTRPRGAVSFASPPARAAVRLPSAQPMAVARALLQARYTSIDGLRLRTHRGDHFHWDSTHWPELKARDVRAAAYAFLEHAMYLHPTKGELSYAPTHRKV